jgi:hypothetical protein
MFDLEKSITSWRAQMRASGINTSVQLDELEAHLREDIARQLQSGMNEKMAFESAITQMGKARELGAEFHRVSGWSGWFGVHRYRILGALWMAFCVASLVRAATPVSNQGQAVFGAFHHGMSATFIASQLLPSFLVLMLLASLYLWGTVAGIKLFFGSLRGRGFLRFLAFLDVFFGLLAIGLGHYTWLTPPLVIFGLISLWLLQPPQQIKTAA